MRKVLMGLGVAVLCLPMLFVGWLLLAARSPRMDASTLKLPMGLRQMVAAVVHHRAGANVTAKLERVVKLDPENGSAWAGLCNPNEDPFHADEELRRCQLAAKYEPTAFNTYWLGRAQDRAGQACAAEESYTQASQKEAGSYLYLQAMGRSALRCGEPFNARAGLQDGLEFADKYLKDTDLDEEDVDEVKEDMRLDREYLVVTFDRIKEPALAKGACSEAHPEWSGCACKLDADAVTCAERKR